MSEWITDRRPTEDDADVHGNVYNELGLYTHWTDIATGRPWVPITPPEPYVKPKRLRVRYKAVEGHWVIEGLTLLAMPLYLLYRDDDAHREAAERIAAIYDEVLP